MCISGCVCAYVGVGVGCVCVCVCVYVCVYNCTSKRLWVHACVSSEIKG